MMILHTLFTANTSHLSSVFEKKHQTQLIFSQFDQNPSMLRFSRKPNEIKW